MLDVQRTSSSSFSGNNNTTTMASSTTNAAGTATGTGTSDGAPGPSVPPAVAAAAAATAPQHPAGFPTPAPLPLPQATAAATTLTATAPYDPMASIVTTTANSSSHTDNNPNTSNNTNNHDTATPTTTLSTIHGQTNQHTNTNPSTTTPLFGSQLRPPTFSPYSQTNNNNNNSSMAALPPPTRESVLQRLSEALLRRSLAKIDLSQKGLTSLDARLVKMALLQNRQLRVLKLGYNQLGDEGLLILVPTIAQHTQLQSLDLGFNHIGDVGCCALAEALTTTSHNNNLRTLYLAGNCIGPDGAMALADVITSRSRRSRNENNNSTKQTATTTTLQQQQQGDTTNTNTNGCCSLKRLYMTGNRLGPDGVKALTEAILEEGIACRMDDLERSSSNGDGSSEDAAMETSSIAGAATEAAATPQSSSSPIIMPIITPPTTSSGMEELFLGGTGLGSAGCQAVARLLASRDCRLQVLSLANCEISDEEITRQDYGLAAALKGNRDSLPLTSLQLSFNSISHKGLEALMNGLWGSKTLKELRLDNNDIGDRGAQQLAAILPYLKTLETLDVGFNNINNKNQGMKILMKAVAEANNLTTLSLSGNPMQDVSSAKAVAYALAYNVSLQSLLLVHCQLTTEGQRHVAAGAVSNSQTSLRDLSGFPVGPVIVTLGFPDALEHWTNEQVLNFIHLMWNKTKTENDNSKGGGEEQGLDPLNFLPRSSPSDPNKASRRSGPLEATIVVDVARKAFASLVANGVDVFSRRPGHPQGKGSPAVLAPRDAIMLESVDGDSIVESMGEVVVSTSRTPSMVNLMELGGLNDGGLANGTSAPTGLSTTKKPAKSFVAAPQERDTAKHSQLPDPSRKKRIVEWLCINIKHLNKLSQMPFDSGELLKLHQHYFTPVVNESGGTSGFGNPATGPGFSSAPNVSRGSSDNQQMEDASSPSFTSSTGFQSGDVNTMVPTSDPMFANGSGSQLAAADTHQQSGSQPVIGSSLPMLKRKVSYRFLGDASMHHHHPTLPPPVSTPSLWGGMGSSNAASVSKMIQNGPSGHHSLPPKNKRARRNRTRISFLPRIKVKLDSYLDVCHEKALGTMRQLYYVEQAILAGRVNPLEENSKSLQHLSGALATDAETIVVDMI